MKCPHCNQTHPDDFIFCPATGKELKKACENKDCPYIGEHIWPLEKESCPICGRPFSSKNNAFSETTSSTSKSSLSHIHDCAKEISEILKTNDYPTINIGLSAPSTHSYSLNDGKIIRPKSSQQFQIFRDPVTGKFGYNRFTDIIIPAKFEQAFPFFLNGTAKVKLEGNYYIIDERGEIVSTADGVFILPYGCNSSDLNLTYDRNTSKYGYAYNEKLIIPTIYQSAYSFKNGVASVKRNGKSYQLLEIDEHIEEKEILD